MPATRNPRPQIPANKFHPPRFAANKMLTRRRLIEEYFKLPFEYQYIFLEAQAGQGKTTTAIQAITQIASSSVWYQMGQEDNDPLYFISALFEGLNRSVNGFSGNSSWGLVASGGAMNLDLIGCVNDMLHHLDTIVQPGFFLVFDDLHLLESAAPSLALLDHLLNTAPASISFMLLSRRPLPLKSKRVKFGGATLYLDNDDLALDSREGIELLEIMLDAPPARQTALQVNKLVGGWAMGLVLAARSIASGREADVCLGRDFQQGLTAYFQEELLNTLPEGLRHAMLQLSLLEGIPIDLAREVTGRPEISVALEELRNQNCFVRSFEDENIYAFHDLFRQALQDLALRNLPQAEIEAILSAAFDHSQRHGQDEAAISYLVRIADYGRLERFLAQAGLRLVLRDRGATLGRIIGTIPAPVLEGSGWFLLFAGLLARKEPSRALELLTAANACFVEYKDGTGELIALSCLISFHAEVSGMFGVGESLLARANELFSSQESELSPLVRAMVAKNIAFGYILFEAETKKAFHYVGIAAQLAEQSDMPNILGATMLIMGYLYHVRGMRHQALAFAEKGYALLADKRVGAVPKTHLRTFLINRLDAEGDYENFQKQKGALVELVGLPVLNNSIIGPLVTLWEVHFAVAHDHLDEAARLLDQAPLSGAAQMQPVQKCQFLLWQALLEAMKGNSAAESTLQRAVEVAELGAGIFLMIFVHNMRGLICCLLDKDDAEEHIRRGMELAREKQINYLLAYAHFVRAFWLMRQGREQQAQGDIREGLRVMKESQYTHIRGWVQAVMVPVLQAAVRQGVQTDFARLLARRKHFVAILDSGEAIPLLRIYVLGDFILKIGPKEMVGAQYFSQGQRQLLAILFSSPDLQIGLHKVMLALWPDSPPDKARTKVDTIVNRLRKTLADLIAPYPVKDYLVVQRGILSLQNSWLDATAFTEFIDWGTLHVNQGEWWQAGNCFSSAMSLWRGCFADGVFLDEQAATFCDGLRAKLIHTALAWGQHLEQKEWISEALEVLERVWPVAPTDEELTGALYRLYVRGGDLRRARTLLQRFAEALERDEMPEPEVRATIDKIMAVVG